MFRKTVFSLKAFFPILFLSFVFQAAVWSQETESTVPELTAMHDVIYPIWHTAYPEKDYAALRKHAPEVKRLAEKVYSAKLPGILRDKETSWQEGVASLKKAVEDYLSATAGTDDQALLNAAEALHARYEALVRTIRPVLKEVDEFHKVLYVIYHKYLPDKDYDNIKAVAGDLKLKAATITKATLPQRLEAQKEKFASAAAELIQATSELAEVCMAGKNEAVAGAVDKVHTKYQSLEKIFD